MTNLDFPTALRRESDRFLECLSVADPTARVTSCPDWNAADLLWHLSEVQFFWGTIVRDRLQDLSSYVAPERPNDHQALVDGFRAHHTLLLESLDATTDDVGVWTWADDHSVGFVRRRQAHEALIHRFDAELIGGNTTPIDPELADDGVDEALTVMFGGYPAWSRFDVTGGVGRVLCLDSGSSWSVTLGRFAGTSPATGRTYDERTLEVARELVPTTAEFTVTGDAVDLDLWLWGRPGAAEPAVAGDQEAAAEFISLIKAGVQ